MPWRPFASQIGSVARETAVTMATGIQGDRICIFEIVFIETIIPANFMDIAYCIAEKMAYPGFRLNSPLKLESSLAGNCINI